MKEEWRDVPECSDYAVSNLGRVLSKERFTNHAMWGRRRLRQRVLKGVAMKNGYKKVALQVGKKVQQRYIHVLVLEAFVGPRPGKTRVNNGSEVRHLDGDKHNNKLDNLAWGTMQENQQDRKLHATK